MVTGTSINHDLPTFLSAVLFSHVLFILYSFILLCSIVLPCA